MNITLLLSHEIYYVTRKVSNSFLKCKIVGMIFVLPLHISHIFLKSYIYVYTYLNNSCIHLGTFVVKYKESIVGIGTIICYYTYCNTYKFFIRILIYCITYNYVGMRIF